MPCLLLLLASFFVRLLPRFLLRRQVAAHLINDLLDELLRVRNLLGGAHELHLAMGRAQICLRVASHLDLTARLLLQVLDSLATLADDQTDLRKRRDCQGGTEVGREEKRQNRAIRAKSSREGKG